LFDIDFAGDATGYATSYDGLVVKTTNAGESWTMLPALPAYVLNAVDFTDPNTGYVAGSSGCIFRTLDGGESWTQMVSGFQHYLQDLFFKDKNTGFATGNAGTLLMTTNGSVQGEPENTVKKEIFRIYPNPASAVVNLSCDLPDKENVNLSLHTSAGQLILEDRCRGGVIHSLNVGNLSPGIYILQLQTTGRVETKKLVIR
jgi:hypothetical protein